jgi:hypothetical protein
MRKAFPGLQLDHAIKPEIVGQVAHTPRHHANLWGWQFAECRPVKMIEMSVGEQDEIDRRQVADAAAGAFDSLQKEKPVGEIGIDENVQVAELNEKRSVTNPSQRNVSFCQLRKDRTAMLSMAASKPGFPNHLIEKSARVEVIAGGEFFERAWDFPFAPQWCR